MKPLLIITLKKITKSTGIVLLKNSRHFTTKDCKKKSKILPTYKIAKKNKNYLKLKGILITKIHKNQIQIKRKHLKLYNSTTIQNKKKISPIKDV